MRALITLTSDFGVQTQGVGTMEATAFAIAPEAKIIHLMHGLPEFDTRSAARTLETIRFLPVGFHVCVVDPGVGTSRKAIVCQVKRGDYLIGPDNGVLLPACAILGGTTDVHQLSNAEYMRQPVSPLFHGRDIFVPAAAHLALGTKIEEFGPALELSELVEPPYGEAVVHEGVVSAEIIQINHFGSLHLNILHENWDEFGYVLGATVTLRTEKYGEIKLRFGETFGDVSRGNIIILKDDYGRIEIAKNLGSFVGEYPLAIGDPVELLLP